MSNFKFILVIYCFRWIKKDDFFCGLEISRNQHGCCEEEMTTVTCITLKEFCAIFTIFRKMGGGGGGGGNSEHTQAKNDKKKTTPWLNS